MQNVAEILKQVPKGTKLWCNIFGEVEFDSIGSNDKYPIRVLDYYKREWAFTDYGYYYKKYEEYGECLLWPSKDHRAWDDEALRILGIEKKPKTPFNLQPFDKVLIRDDDEFRWNIDFFSHIDDTQHCSYICAFSSWEQCIPYNDETKHLLGTNQEPPEKYRLSM